MAKTAQNSLHMFTSTKLTSHVSKQENGVLITLIWLQTWALGEGIKILCIKDHVRSSINYSRERIRAITNASLLTPVLQ